MRRDANLLGTQAAQPGIPWPSHETAASRSRPRAALVWIMFDRRHFCGGLSKIVAALCRELPQLRPRSAGARPEQPYRPARRVRSSVGVQIPGSGAAHQTSDTGSRKRSDASLIPRARHRRFKSPEHRDNLRSGIPWNRARTTRAIDSTTRDGTNLGAAFDALAVPTATPAQSQRSLDARAIDREAPASATRLG